MRPRSLVLAAALALAPALALAAPPPWSVDKAASRLTFSSSASGAAFTGSFSRWDAEIHFDPKDLAHSDVAATIDITSAANRQRRPRRRAARPGLVLDQPLPARDLRRHGFSRPGPAATSRPAC